MATLAIDTDQQSLPEAVDAALPGAAGPRARAAAPVASGGPTLEDLVARSWSSLALARAAACAWCGGELVARYGAGPHPVAGTCRDCGTEIA